MELIVTVPDTFYSMPLTEQERTLRKALKAQKEARQNLIRVIEATPESKTNLTEEQQIAIVDAIRKEVYPKK